MANAVFIHHSFTIFQGIHHLSAIIYLRVYANTLSQLLKQNVQSFETGCCP